MFDHLPIHLCDWSQQPDIHIYCDDSWTTPHWKQEGEDFPEEGDPVGCYLTSDEPLRKYAFDFEKVNCPACLSKAKGVSS